MADLPRDIPSDKWPVRARRTVDPQWREIQRMSRDYEMRRERGEISSRHRGRANVGFRKQLFEKSRNFREGRRD
jgi:hypothetical protein